MKRPLLRWFSALLSAFTCAAALAVAPAGNYSDLWGDAAETGWGLNLAQQGGALFGTMFVYGAGGDAVWYSSTFVFQAITGNGVRVYEGDLYLTQGTPQGATYDPTLLKYHKVGLATLEFGDESHALLRYNVGPVVVVKQVARTTFAPISPAGDFIGATTDVTENCNSPANNGLVTTDSGAIRITMLNNFATIHAPTCFYEGDYVQHGQVGSLDGRYECTNKATGEVKFTGLRFESGGLVGNYTGRDSSCHFRGTIGGARKVP